MILYLKTYFKHLKLLTELTCGKKVINLYGQNFITPNTHCAMFGFTITWYHR